MPVFPFQRATKTFQAFPDYEILLKYTELRKFVEVGTVDPRIHCLRRREWWQGDQQTTRGLGGKAFAQLVVGIHATLQRQQTPGQDQGFQGFFSFFLICIWSNETARNSWHKECIERSNNSASIASISQQRATDVSMWEWGVLEVCSIHIYSLKHHIYIYIYILYYHPIVSPTNSSQMGLYKKKWIPQTWISIRNIW